MRGKSRKRDKGGEGKGEGREEKLHEKRGEEEGKTERRSEAARNDEWPGSLFSQHRKVKAVARAEAIWMSPCFSRSASRTYGE